MIENSVIFISAYIIALVCNNIFFVLFLFSNKMKLLLFSESIIFLTFSSTDFRTQFVWMGVFFFTGWEFFDNFVTGWEFPKKFLDFFFNFFVTGWEFKFFRHQSRLSYLSILQQPLLRLVLFAIVSNCFLFLETIGYLVNG